MDKTSEWLDSFSSLKTNHQIKENLLKTAKKNTNKKTKIISVTGGKGGVGKTSISLKLSKELSLQGHRVLLIDCDYNLSNTAIKLGLPVNDTFYSLVCAEKSFDECLYKSGNFHLLSACNGSVDLFDFSFRSEQLIIDIITGHEKDYDYIFLDCPAGLSRESLTLNAYCDERIVVVTPDRASITDSYSLIKILSKKFGINKNHIIINMVESRKQFERVVKSLSETIENYLGGRSKILGGVRKIDVLSSKFDDFFLGRGKNVHHQNFLQVVKKLTDELGKDLIVERKSLSQANELIEQEVH